MYPSGESETMKKWEAERHQAMTVEKRSNPSRDALSVVTAYPTSRRWASCGEYDLWEREKRTNWERD
jgi:hypothetical protein